MFHGCSTDPVGGAGPLEHGDWLVQTVPTILTCGPYISSTHAAGVSDVTGQLRTTAWHSVLVTEGRSPTPVPPETIRKWTTATGPQLSRGCKAWPEDDNKKPLNNQSKTRWRDREWQREMKEGETEVANQSLAGVWQSCLTPSTFLLVALFLFSSWCFLHFLLWAPAVEHSVQHAQLLSHPSFGFFLAQPLFEHLIEAESVQI